MGVTLSVPFLLSERVNLGHKMVGLYLLIPAPAGRAGKYFITNKIPVTDSKGTGMKGL